MLNHHGPMGGPRDAPYVHLPEDLEDPLTVRLIQVSGEQVCSYLPHDGRCGAMAREDLVRVPVQK